MRSWRVAEVQRPDTTLSRLLAAEREISRLAAELSAKGQRAETEIAKREDAFRQVERYAGSLRAEIDKLHERSATRELEYERATQLAASLEAQLKQINRAAMTEISARDAAFHEAERYALSLRAELDKLGAAAAAAREAHAPAQSASDWPDTRLIDLFGVEFPIVQAPMANSGGVDMAVAVAEAGGLGSFPCAGLSDDKVREGLAAIRSRTSKPINVNFFCHAEPARELAREAAWLDRLVPYYKELGVETPKPP